MLWDFMTSHSDKHAILWDKKEEKGRYIEYTPYGPDFISFMSSHENTVIRAWNNIAIQYFKEKTSLRNNKFSERL